MEARVCITFLESRHSVATPHIFCTVIKFIFMKGSIILGFMVSGKSITNSIMLVKPATCWQFGMSKYYPRDYERHYPMPYCCMLREKNSCIVFGLIQLFIKYTRHSHSRRPWCVQNQGGMTPLERETIYRSCSVNNKRHKLL